jgi:hypothetical protein
MPSAGNAEDDRANVGAPGAPGGLPLRNPRNADCSRVQSGESLHQPCPAGHQLGSAASLPSVLRLLQCST